MTRNERFHATTMERTAMTMTAPAPGENGTRLDVPTASNPARTTARQPLAEGQSTGEDGSPPIAPVVAAMPRQSSSTDDAHSAATEASQSASATNAAPDIDGDSIRAYRLALAREARRFRHYPERAREAGWHGRVTLRIDFAGPTTLVIASSSGQEVLDQAALAMMQQAVARVPPPATLRTRTASLELTIEFDLTHP